MAAKGKTGSRVLLCRRALLRRYTGSSFVLFIIRPKDARFKAGLMELAFSHDSLSLKYLEMRILFIPLCPASRVAGRPENFRDFIRIVKI